MGKLRLLEVLNFSFDYFLMNRPDLIEIIFNIINCFTATPDQFNVSLLNNSFNFLFLLNILMALHDMSLEYIFAKTSASPFVIEHT